MSGTFDGDGILATLLSESGYSGVPDVRFCDTLLAQCLDALPTKIALTDTSGTLAFCNRATYEFFGPRLASARYARDRERLFHPDDVEVTKAARQKVLRTGLGVRVELRSIRYDYKSKWHSHHLTPLFNKAARITSLLITMNDMPDEHAAAGSRHQVADGI